MKRVLLVVNSVDALATTVAEAQAGKLLVTGSASGIIGIAGTPGGYVTFSSYGKTMPPVQIGDLVDVSTQNYSAGQAASVEVDFTNAVVGADGLMDVTIVDSSQINGAVSSNRRSFYGATVQAIADEINLLGGTEGSMFYDFGATVSGNVLTIAGPDERTFKVAAINGASISYTANMEPPVGTPSAVRKIEDQLLTMHGPQNFVGHPVVRPASDVLDTKQYNMVVATFQTRYSRVDVPGRPNGYNTLRLIFALANDVGTPATDINAANLTTLLEKLK